ncbi:MAG: hypothetical protein HY899_07575 [Deltaproteobacteria bacterium]|nr:hypothetical protein [Deltaproteobacteria bacterium]
MFAFIALLGATYVVRALRLPRRSTSAFLVGVLVLCLWRIPSAQAGALVIDVDSDQRAPVVGRAPSLRTVVQELCWRAGARLDFYDAEDRPAGGAYRDMALGELLGRLLSRESYMAGTMRDPVTGKDRVLWLRVLGDPATAAARRASGAGNSSQAGFQVPPVLLQTALSAPGQNPAARQAALAALAARISGDAQQLEAFLATDSRLIAEAIARFDRASESLRELRGNYSDPRVTAKLDEILAALARAPGPP